MTDVPADIKDLDAQLTKAADDWRALVNGLTEEQGQWRPDEGAWSVAECLDHLAVANRLYLAAMDVAAEEGREAQRWRRGPAVPGMLGRPFVKALEPPVRPLFRIKAPMKIQPKEQPTLNGALGAFLKSQEGVSEFLARNKDLDLAGIRFVNPFIPGVRFSLATALHVIAAHERRHLWQSARVLEAHAAAGANTLAAAGN